MTPEECQRLRYSVPIVFPAIAAWWSRLDERTRSAMERRNVACLIDCDYADAVAVVAELAKDAIDPWPYDGDKERAAAIIAKAANERRRERKERERGPSSIMQSGAYARPRGVASLWEQADRLAKYRASVEWTQDGDADLIAELMGPEEIEDRRFWVSCRECFDTGSIVVLSSIRWVRPWLGIGEPHIVHTTAAAACQCSAGDPWRKRKLPLPDFDKTAHVKIPLGATSKTAAEVFTEWQRTTAASKRIGSFDAYNERAVARDDGFV